MLSAATQEPKRDQCGSKMPSMPVIIGYAIALEADTHFVTDKVSI